MKTKLILCLTILFLFACTEKTEQKPLSEQQSKTEATAVDFEIASKKPFHKQIMSNGVLEAVEKSELRFKISDRISSIYVANGSFVKKGQLIAVLDNELSANRLERAKLDFEKAKNKLREETINFGIGGALSELEPSVVKNLQIKSGYLEAKNALENAELLHNQTLLRAPFDGLVANLETKAGNYASMGDVFCSVISRKELNVAFYVLENELPLITKGTNISLTSFVDPTKKYSATISEINPMVDKNGLIKVRARITSKKDFLFDGMNLKVCINRTVSNTIVIPKEALVLRSNKDVVFTLENGKAKWNYVKKSDENSSSYSLEDGLKIGDTILVSGNMNLSHDAKVKISLAQNTARYKNG